MMLGSLGILSAFEHEINRETDTKERRAGPPRLCAECQVSGKEQR